MVALFVSVWCMRNTSQMYEKQIHSNLKVKIYWHLDMCQGAAETGLFQEGRQHWFSPWCCGVVLQERQSEWNRAGDSKRAQKTSTETISLGRVRSLVQVIPTVSAQAGKTSEDRYSCSTSQTRTRGIELTSNSALHPCGKGRAPRQRWLGPLQLTRILRALTPPQLVFSFIKRMIEWVDYFFSSALWCLYNFPFSQISTTIEKFNEHSRTHK